jgi:hypothetical protein
LEAEFRKLFAERHAVQAERAGGGGPLAMMYFQHRGQERRLDDVEKLLI